MDETLALDPVDARLPLDGPFTRGMAAAAGVQRGTLARLVRAGSVCRVLRGVYAASSAVHSPGFRASAVALAAGPGAVVVERTAAWVHGVDVGVLTAELPLPLDLVRPVTAGSGPSRSRLGLAGRDLQSIDGLHLTTPLRTALDLGRLLPEADALAALDQLLRAGTFTHVQLLAELARMAGHHGVGQLRRLAVQVDSRARSSAESALRLHWHAADLPTAVPGALVDVGGRLVRVALGVHRCQFGAVLADGLTAEDHRALRASGWHVVVLTPALVLGSDSADLGRHLEREFHQHLLRQIA